MITIMLALIVIAIASFAAGRFWRRQSEEHHDRYAARVLFQPEADSSDAERLAGGLRSPVWAIALAGLSVWLVIDRAILLLRTPLPPSVRSLVGTVEQITTEHGVEALPTVSPDGEWVAYRSDASGTGDILIRRIGDPGAHNLTLWMKAEESDPAFSPDGRFIAFKSTYQNGGIYIVDRDGSGLRRVTQFGASPAWTPNGRAIVFATRSSIDPRSGALSGDVYVPSGIRSGGSEGWIVNVESRVVSRLSRGDFRQPSVSPDGRRVAYWAAPMQPAAGTTLQRRETGLWTIAIDGSDPRQVVPRGGPTAVDWNPVWSPDGEFLYFLSDRGGRVGIWRAAMDVKAGTSLGRVMPMAFDAARAASLAIAGNGRRLAWSTAEWSPSLLRIDYDPDTRSARGVPAAVPGVRPFRCMEPSPDGAQLAGVSDQQQPDVYIVRIATGEVRPITRDHAVEGCPRWSRDGTRVAFHSNAGGRHQVWIANADGSGLRATPQIAGEQMNPVWFPDGKSLVATDPESRGNRIYYVDANGALTPSPYWLQSLDQEFTPVEWSADGSKIAGTAGGAVWVFDMKTVLFERLIPGSHPTWLSSSRRLIVAAEGRLILVDVATRFTREILALPDLYLSTPTLSPDDRHLYFSRNAPESNVWLATLR